MGGKTMELQGPKIRTMLAVALGGAALVVSGATDLQADSVRLQVQSAWPLTLPASGRDAQHFADTINTISGGSIDIWLHGAGALVPPLEIFDAVQRGTLDAGYTSPLYVAGKWPAVQLFGGVPMGPDIIGYVGWLYNGGGLDIWREIYGAEGVVTVPCGLMDSEAGGWYREPIETVNDLQGLRLRFAGLAGEVLRRLGASTVLLAGGDIFPNLERGVIDGLEFSMPAIDAAMGFEQIVKNYYLPGWHQPAAINELIINQMRWDAMTETQQAMIETVCRETMLWGLTSTYIENSEAIQKFRDAGVEIREFTDELLEAFEQATEEVMAEQSAQDPMFARAWESLNEYRSRGELWENLRQ
jgi:TRAP-type mannitol/chloroaromatic compound transport system substrate-binding protein